MSSNKIIRSLCYFTDNPKPNLSDKLEVLADKLTQKGYVIQTKRICISGISIKKIGNLYNDDSILLSVGTLNFSEARKQLRDFYKAQRNISFNVELSDIDITKSHTKLLFDIIKNDPSKTFNFAYVFNNNKSSPFFPSGAHEKNGFGIGLQPTDLSENCKSLDEWLVKMKVTWHELYKMFSKEKEFLGIDSSVAPIFSGKGSFVNFVKRLGMDFSHSVTTDFYTRISRFIKINNPKPVGLNGLMFPCLEDFELADEYSKGNFSIERNIYLSLHSGLGIDTYPIGVNESPKKLIEILSLVKELSNKYKKPLSARFVSDGKTKIGEKTEFQNQYLKDVVVRKL